MGAAFFTGLLSGFGSSYLDREKQKHDEALKDTESRKRILETVMNNPDTRPEERQAILKILLTPGQERGKGKGGKGKQQGGDALQQFLNKLGGMGTGTTPPFQGGGGATGSPSTGGGSGGGQGGTTATPAARPMSEKTPIGGSSTQLPPSALSVGPVPSSLQPKNGSASLSVPPVPQRGIFLSQEEKEQQELDFEKRRYEQVTKPQQKEESKLRIEEDQLREVARENYEDKVEKARQDREDARQRAFDVRQKNQQGFQERIEKLKETASSQRQMDHDIAMLRLTDVKAADALEKQASINRAKNVSETLRTLQQQITASTSLLKSREAEAQKQPWYQFWQDAPDTAAAQEDIDNAKAALTFLTDHKTAVISGKEDLDEITDKTEDILRNGQPEWSRGDWQKANPGKDVKAAELKAMKQGMKVVP